MHGQTAKTQNTKTKTKTSITHTKTEDTTPTEQKKHDNEKAETTQTQKHKQESDQGGRLLASTKAVEIKLCQNKSALEMRMRQSNHEKKKKNSEGKKYTC
jgi:hypothetical protein